MKTQRIVSWTYKRLMGLALLASLAVAGVAAQDQEIPLGSSMPLADKPLTHTDGSQTTLTALAGETATVVTFWSNQCPWVEKYEARLLSMVEAYAAQGVSIVLVNANNPEKFPRESLEESRQRAADRGYSMAYLVDEGSALANEFGATRTPQFFVFDSTLVLAYSGTLDNSPGNEARADKHYLSDALGALVNGDEPPVTYTKPFGCMIKFYD